MLTLNLPKIHPIILGVCGNIFSSDVVKITSSNKLSLLCPDGSSITNLNSILHTIYENNQEKCLFDLYTSSNTFKWIDQVYNKDPSKHPQIKELLTEMNLILLKSKFLTGDCISFADLGVITYLEKCRPFTSIEKPNSVIDWANRCLSHPSLKDVVFKNVKTEQETQSCTLEQGGRFVPLPQAALGNVVVRFPPEASGYLHIGHAKAALLNQFYRDKYNGKLILRFDDTNPVKEKGSFEEIILEDIRMLGLTPDIYSRTSDHFDTLLGYADQLVSSGDAFCDDSSQEIMKDLRAKRLPSPYRDTPISDNQSRWEAMKKGQLLNWCLRLKIDFASTNGCLRDPTIYRSCLESHVATGTKYKVYPTYDFACPIVDSIEGVTHALRTSEYHDRDAQYLLVLRKLNLREPKIFEYSRLNMQYTILSKRKLSKIVEQGLVDGWDDPRMPTVRGLLRHGLTPAGLREYVLAQGFSRSEANVSPDKLWAFNKKLVEPTAPVLTAIDSKDMIKVLVRGEIPQSTNVPLNPKETSSNLKTVIFSSEILIEASDAKLCQNNITITLFNWGNAIVHRLADGIELELDPLNKDYSNTPKITWLPAESVSNRLVPITILSYGNLLKKSSVSPDDQIEALVDSDSKVSWQFLGESFFANLTQGSIVQILRKGLFICDHGYSKDRPILIKIPSGRGLETNSKNPIKKSTNGSLASKKIPPPNSKISNGSQAHESKINLNKKSKLGLSVKKTEDFSLWYTETLTKSEMLEYYNVSGCYVIRPHAYSVWEHIQKFLDTEIKKLGVENCYFPLFVSQSALNKEQQHISGFAPEVAWVTKAGDTELQEPIAIRPTSETVIYPLMSKWVQSHRDLPLKLNQWCNVVRWEFKHPTPFLRTREFLWQEGHTAYTTREAAVTEVYEILDIYTRIYEELLAIPVIKGIKTEAEKFAGAEFTTTIEGYILHAGRGIQCATSHHLGQNFSKMFDIAFEDPNNEGKQLAYQNSWGLSTRSIGAMVMIHGDDRGLVMPPKVAPTQVVIIPCGLPAQSTQEAKSSLSSYCKNVFDALSSVNVRVYLDDRDHVTSGWKFNHYELKGVPLRVEIGPKDIKMSNVTLVRRDNLTKTLASVSSLPETVLSLLNEIQNSVYLKAKKDLDDNIVLCDDWKNFTNHLKDKRLIYVPFCGSPSCEEQIRHQSTSEHEEPDGKGGFRIILNMGAKSLCIPLTKPKKLEEDTKCIRISCENKAKFYTLFGRSF